MAGLVEELQRDAADANVSVTSLLRKVKITASKLALDDVEQWVVNELNGYKTPDLPEYRLLSGIPRAYNPVRRDWIPLHLPSEILDTLKTVHVAEKVAQLETLAEPPDSPIHYRIAPYLIDALNQHLRVPFAEMCNFVQKSQIIGILDAVRNEVLDWSLKLERKGITGEGYSFSDREKTMAKDPTINIGSIQNFNGNLGSNNQSGDITTNILDKSKALLDLVHQARQYAPQLIEAGADEDKLLPTIKLLEEEIKRPVIDADTVTPLVQDLRNSVSGAAGNLIASGLLAAIAAVAG